MSQFVVTTSVVIFFMFVVTTSVVSLAYSEAYTTRVLNNASHSYVNIECRECYGIRLSKVYKNPHPQGWGYTDKARLRGLKPKTDFYQPDLV
ncbi:hypothetical protein [Oscillatoria sp. HE19RPO]|uniref:hypothetical protein n=1 Tax=Oscillatoria sp. HE19RPO TaxID=2954806 RepID=UPI0020C1F994|nr:hypothetical protein [Oscillatoria sp. HE19RPO]